MVFLIYDNEMSINFYWRWTRVNINFVTLLAKKTLMYPLIGTFFVNIVGCFIIGFVFALTINQINNFPIF